MNITALNKKTAKNVLSVADGTYQEYLKSHHERKVKYRKEVQDWLTQFNFKYFITITFAFNINRKKRDSQVKEIISMLSNEYYNRNQRKKGLFLEGFCFIEKQNTRNQHYHILIQDNDIFNFKRNRKKNFRTVCFDKCSRIESFNKQSIDTNLAGDRSNGLDVQTTYSNRVIEYLSKTYEKTENFDFIHPLDKHGFSPTY